MQFSSRPRKTATSPTSVSNWDEGIEPWSFGMNYGLWESTAGPARIGLHGSRRLQARRGRARQGDRARPTRRPACGCWPTARSSTSRCTTAAIATVDHRTVTVNRWSSADWTWTVPAGATLGDYAVAIELPEPRRQDHRRQRRHARERRRRLAAARFTDRFSSPRIAGRTSAWTRRPTIDAAGRGSRRSTRRSTRAISSAARWRNRPVHWSLTHDPDFSVPSAITDQRQWADYHVRLLPGRGHAAWRQFGRGGRRDARRERASSRCPCRPIARRGLRVPLHVRRRRRGRVASAHRQPRRASSCIPRRGTSACGCPTTSPIRRRARPSMSSRRRSRRRGGHRRPRSSCRSSASSGIRSATPKASGFYSWETQKRREAGGRMDRSRRRRRPASQAIPVPEGGSYDPPRDRERRGGTHDAHRDVLLRHSATATPRGSASTQPDQARARAARRGSPARPRG